MVILYDTQSALSRATGICERIMTRFWQDLDIEMAHWPLDSLAEAEHGEAAASKAAAADILVVAASGTGKFPEAFASWTERWLARRNQHEGALVGLFDPGTGSKGESASRDIQLHQLALRAGMDYLRHLPSTPLHSIPDSTEWCASRAERLTGTLDEIIRSNPRPPEG
jgi:hypothetical protein